jgi:hypothetical protein
MPTSSITEGSKHSALRKPGDPRVLTMEEVIPYLVGHTVDEVERELIIHTLIHHCGGAALGPPIFSEFRSGAFAIKFASTKT